MRASATNDFEAMTEQLEETLEDRSIPSSHAVFPKLEAAMEQMSDEELENIAVNYTSRPDEKESLSPEDRGEISRLAQAEMLER